jgi:polyisoprenoid-binding protein YceI
MIRMIGNATLTSARAILALAPGLVSLPVWAADSYTIDPRHTHPSYEIDHFGWSTQRGRFDRVTGTISLDPDAKTGKVEVSMDANSISTGVDKLDEHLRSADFLNAAKYPSITFRAAKIKFGGDAPASVPGEITILGVTRPITLTITRFGCGPHPIFKRYVCGAEASAVIKRSEFGMTKYLPALGDEVKLLINVEAYRDRLDGPQN